MRFRDNVLLQYTVSTFTVILIFSLILGSVLARFTSEIQMKKHLDLYPQITKQVLEYHPEAVRAFTDKHYSESAGAMQGLAEDLLAFDDVFRVKLWGEDNVILWSDDPSLIGKPFPDNADYREALLGKVVHRVDEPNKEEQLTESSHKQVLEIYTPVFYQGKVVGVFEMYEASDVLFEELQANLQTVWWAVSGFGLTVYVLLFVIFYRSHHRQLRLNQDLQKTQEITIMSLAAVAETRDKETGKHILRTRRYVELLARELRNHPRFRAALNQEAIDLLVKSSPLHDIGKVGVPDHILLKPGKLTPEEFEEIKKHPVYGRDALSVAEEEMGTNTFLETAREIAYTHHEKWDGSGYPRGISGDEIPVSGRLMALADVYDALVNERIYKKAYSHQTAIEMILEGSGQHFDPDVVDAFMKHEAAFAQIAMELSDDLSGSSSAAI